MRVTRLTPILCAAAWVLLLLIFGILLGDSQAQANPLSSRDDQPQATNTPTMLPTSMPNLRAGVSWLDSCSPPILNITTYSNSIPPWRCINPSVMRLTNSLGEYVER